MFLRTSREDEVMSKIELYWVRAGDEENNFDLFVRAASPARAIELWRSTYEFEADEESESIRLIRNAALDGQGEGALCWEGDVPKVWPVDPS
jgi:hypothetical protein